MGFWSDALLHTILPRACAHCRKDLRFDRNEPLCSDCIQALPPPPKPACVRCGGRLGIRRDFCFNCAGRLFACRLIRARTSHRGSAASLVHAFKFRGSRSAARSAGTIMAEDFIERDEFKLIDGLVPIPLHPQRERERGYNQAELLSLALGTATGTPLLPLLSRPRGAKPSWQLGRIERQAELSGAFRTVEGAGRIALGRRLVLIDDVCATGTTLEECAAALRRSGAKDVTAYVFSRAGRLT